MFWKKRLKPYDERKAKELQNGLDESGGLEKDDLKAMIIAAMTTIIPVALAVLLFISLLVMWIFGII